MIVFLDATGNKIINSQAEPIGRNSNDAAVFYIVVAAPISDAAQIYMTFTLPNGKTLFGNMARPEDPENLSDDDRRTASYLFGVEGTDYSVWRYRVPEKITSIQGTVQYTIVTITDSMTATASGSFTVSKGNRTAFPEDYVPTSMQDFVKEISGNLSDMKERLDANLYGEGGNAEAPIEGSPVYRIGELEENRLSIAKDSENIIYANDFDGKPTVYPVDPIEIEPEIASFNIVRRGFFGEVFVPDPIQSNLYSEDAEKKQAANKGYVDSKFEEHEENETTTFSEIKKALEDVKKNHDTLRADHKALSEAHDTLREDHDASFLGLQMDVTQLKQAFDGEYYFFKIDSETKYQKKVPEGTMQYARVENVPQFVDGNPVEIEVSSKNLLYKFVTQENIEAASRTAAGVSIKVNLDGSILLNGTAENYINIGLAGGGVHVANENDGGTPTHHTYVLEARNHTISLRDSKGELVPYGGRIFLIFGTLGENVSSVAHKWGQSNGSVYPSPRGGMGCCVVHITKGATFNNETFYPQLEVGSEITSYARPQLVTYPYNTSYINVAGGEIITFKNDAKSRVMSTITYQIKIGGTT